MSNCKIVTVDYTYSVLGLQTKLELTRALSLELRMWPGPLAVHVANVAQLEAVAADGTGGCVAVVGNVWTSAELDGGKVKRGVVYAVQVAVLNSVGLGAPKRNALCHDVPCMAGDVLLAPAAPPLAPIDATTTSHRVDRTALNVVWKTPSSTNGAPVLQYPIEYSTAAFGTSPLTCSAYVVALTAGR